MGFLNAYRAILKFMEKFDKLAIARGNFACGELERALQYLELYMDGDRQRVQSQLPFLAEIYALLDEPDSVAGNELLYCTTSSPHYKISLRNQKIMYNNFIESVGRRNKVILVN